MTAPVSAPYLDAALARCRLPVHAAWDPAVGENGLYCVWRGKDAYLWMRATAESATRAYLALCAELLERGAWLG